MREDNEIPYKHDSMVSYTDRKGVNWVYIYLPESLLLFQYLHFLEP